MRRKYILIAAFALALPLVLTVPASAGGWGFGLSYSSGHSWYGGHHPVYHHYRPSVYRSYGAATYYPYYRPVRSVYVEHAYVPSYRSYSYDNYDRPRYYSGRSRSSYSFGYSQYGRSSGFSLSYRSGGGGWVPGYVDGRGRYQPGCYR